MSINEFGKEKGNPGKDMTGAQGEKAVLRVVFRPREGYVEVKGFGHRFKPADIYHRMVLGSDIRL